MARYTWREGMKIAESEAWRTKGKQNANLFVYGRFIPWLLGAAALGALGYYAKKAWDRLVGALGSNTDTAPAAVAHSGIPAWVWVVGVVLTIATVVGVRAGRNRFRSFTEVALTTAGLALAWIGFLAFVLGAL